MSEMLEQLWKPVVRTPAQLAEIARNNAEWAEPPGGYPSLTPGPDSGRLYLSPVEVRACQMDGELLGKQVRLYDLPPGHDAICSPERQATLGNMSIRDSLLYPPDPEFPTGQGGFLEDSPQVQRWVVQGCRDFTTELRPLIPGIDQLLSLRTRGVEGEPLGIPTGMGSYTSHGLARMADAVVLYVHPNDEIDVLLTGRPEDGVWGTIGGFGNRQDVNREGVYDPALAALRRCRQEAGLETERVHTILLRRDYPASGRTTASAGLVTEPSAVLVGKAHHEAYGRINPGDRVRDYAGWVGLRYLLAENGDARDGQVNPQSEVPVWTTHMRYIASAAEALKRQP